MKKRFPTLSHLCEAGVVTENEARIFQGLDDKCIGDKIANILFNLNFCQGHPKYFVSLV